MENVCRNGSKTLVCVHIAGYSIASASSLLLLCRPLATRASQPSGRLELDAKHTSADLSLKNGTIYTWLAGKRLNPSFGMLVGRPAGACCKGPLIPGLPFSLSPPYPVIALRYSVLRVGTCKTVSEPVWYPLAFTSKTVNQDLRDPTRLASSQSF